MFLYNNIKQNFFKVKLFYKFYENAINIENRSIAMNT